MRRMAIVAAALCWLSAGQAHAQGVTVSGGYQLLAIPVDDTVLPAGWLVSVAGRPGRVMAPVFEAGVAVKQDGYGLFQLWSVQGGARFFIPTGSVARVRPFAQLVAGVMGTGCCREASAYIMIEPGGGVDVPIGRRTSAHVGVGVPLLFTGDGVARLVRVYAGLSVRLGR